MLTLAHAGAWDQFVRRTPQDNPFARSDWLRHYSEAFGVEVLLPCLLEDAGIVAGAPLLVKRRGPWKISTPMAIGAYHGPLVSSGAEDQTGEEISRRVGLLCSAIADAVALYSASLHPSLASLPAPPEKRWSRATLGTYLLPIGDTDAAWSGMSQSLRRKLRRGFEQEAVVGESDDIRRLVELHCASYSRKAQKSPLPERLLLAWLASLHRAGLVRIFALRDKRGAVAAMRAIVRDNAMAYDFVAGMDPAAGLENASHLLVWRIVEILSREGAAQFDFMGANSAGPAEFKRSFGSLRIPYLMMHYRRSAAIRLAEKSRSLIVRRRRGI